MERDHLTNLSKPSFAFAIRLVGYSRLTFDGGGGGGGFSLVPGLGTSGAHGYSHIFSGRVHASFLSPCKLSAGFWYTELAWNLFSAVVACMSFFLVQPYAGKIFKIPVL